MRFEGVGNAEIRLTQTDMRTPEVLTFGTNDANQPVKYEGVPGAEIRLERI